MRTRAWLLGAGAAGLLVMACGSGNGGGGGDSAGAATAALTGAGATFPDPIYKKWAAEYARATGVQINYQSIGSGGGIRQYTEGTVDFGATDGPMTAEQLAAVQGRVIHLPTVLGAVVATYNLPGVPAGLKLDGPVLADIFLGKITKWNDARIGGLNPGVSLPDSDIIVVHRSDGSGTTFIFTDYLSKVSAEWKGKVGNATSVNWPVGLGGRGNEGVTGQVKQTTGSIGYVELIYAITNQLPYAHVRNTAGNFIEPSLASVTAAAASASFAPDTDFRVSITNPAGADAYPIASFTWLLIHPDLADVGKARALKAFLDWILTDEAQQMAATLHYAPLPAAVSALAKERVRTLTAAGQPIS
jgi:phosphate transport system substrate-binding protein